MQFNFIRYTQPGWQFNLEPETEEPAPACKLGENIDFTEEFDLNFETEAARKSELAYRLWNKGYLLVSTREAIRKEANEKPTLHDEYVFIRKYWGNSWAIFALFVRLGTFKNPIHEITQFAKTRKIQKADIFESPLLYNEYDSFKSELVASLPKVAVIIPTLNRYSYLRDVLADLEKQTYSNFEVIIIDQSDQFDATFYNSFSLHIILTRQTEKLLWTARNRAINSTDARFLLFFDDDSRVKPDWITEHLKCLDFFKADISAGVSLAVSGQKISRSYNYFRWADQLDSGNTLIKREVFHRIGLFDEQFNGQRMGDGEFAYRAFMHGIKSISNYKASRIHLKVSTGGLREMGSWDGFRPKKWFSPKPVPSVIYLYRKYLPPHLRKNALFIGIMLSNVPYRSKRSSKMLLLSVLLMFIKSPLLLFRYLRASHLAKRMLRNDKGPARLVR